MRSKNRSVPPDGPQPGAYSVPGRAPGQLPVWARRSSIRSGRRSSAMRHRSLTSPDMSPRSRNRSPGPELTELSSTQSTLMGEDDVLPLSLLPIPDTPLSAPHERTTYTSWRDNVDIPGDMVLDRLPLSDEDRLHRSSRSSSSGSVPRDSSLPQAPSFSYIPPELRPAQEQGGNSSSIRSGPQPDQSLPSYVQPELRPVPNEGDDNNIDEFVDSGSDFIVNGHAQKSRRRTCLLFLFAILAGVGIGVGVGMSQGNKNEATSSQQGRSSEPIHCDFSGNDMIPSAFLQCECDGIVTLWTDETRAQYYNLRDTFIPTILPNFDHEEQSCDPSNAALWQLSNDTLFGANASDTRYLLELLYGNWDGEGWRRKQGWLSVTTPECKWEGIACNTEDQVRRLSLGSNNLGGTIPTEIALLTSLRT